MIRRSLLALAFILCLAAHPPQNASAQNAAVAEKPAAGAVSKTDNSAPGVGPIRAEDWFQKIWRDRRAAFADQEAEQQHALVFFGDSITQGWGDDFRGNFPGVKTANRGISGDTTRGLLTRLDDDVLALNPRGIVLLIGTNDIDLKVPPAGIAANVKQLLARIAAHDPELPIILCQVFPTSGKMNRPTEKIRELNRLLAQVARGNEQVTVLDTYTLFANDAGEAKPKEFPDLLHPNDAGYAKWRAALWPLLATLGFVETEPDSFTPEAGFEPLFNGRNLDGWGLRPTSAEDLQAIKNWRANDPNMPPLADRQNAGQLRRQNGLHRRPLPRHQWPPGRHHADRRPAHSAALHDSRLPRRLHAQTGIPRHPKRRQRRLPPRPPAPMPRLPARRPVQESQELHTRPVERTRRHRERQQSPLHGKRRSPRRSVRPPRHRPHRPRSRPRPNGIPSDTPAPGLSAAKSKGFCMPRPFGGGLVVSRQ